MNEKNCLSVLENHAYIVGQLCGSWGSGECSGFLESLLDISPRKGRIEGFTPQALEELRWLRVLHDEAYPQDPHHFDPWTVRQPRAKPLATSQARTRTAARPRETPESAPPAMQARHFGMLEEIAKDLSRKRVIFPIHFGLSLKIQKALKAPSAKLEQVARLIRLDPYLAATVVTLARTGQPPAPAPLHLESALAHIGLQSARHRLLDVITEQLLKSRNMVAFRAMSEGLWLHSLSVAAAATVVCRRLTQIPEDEAYYAGLVHDIGAFYVLYKASQDDELQHQADEIKSLASHWHANLGHDLLAKMFTPSRICRMVRDHEHLKPLSGAPASLEEVMRVANILAATLGHGEFDQEVAAILPVDELPPLYHGLLAEVRNEFEALLQTVPA